MPWLIWRHETDRWGCEDCGLLLPKPKPRESVGEYIARIRNQFDLHKCKNHPLSGFQLAARHHEPTLHSRLPHDDEVDPAIARRS